MLDFLLPKHRETRRGKLEVFPDWRVSRSKDLMIRGNNFYAIWDEEKGLWSTDEYDVQRLVDKELYLYAERLRESQPQPVYVLYMSDFKSNSWVSFKQFVNKLSDQSKQLDNQLTFSNTEVKKDDYVSRRLPYPLEAGHTPAFDLLFNTLYDEENLRKIMWAIGSIVAGQSKHIQKFFVLFGAPGTGKSTTLNLIQTMFPDYYTSFEAQALTNGASSFSAEVFSDNPLIGINHEGDLSKIRDNSLLNSIVAHDRIVMNVKYHKAYPIRLNTMLFIATNKPVTITDYRSGLIRRLIDVRPTGQRVTQEQYDELTSQMSFELGAIAHKCAELFNELGKSYYDRYKPVDMMLRTNVFYNFVEENFFIFAKEPYITLRRAWQLYKEYCEDSEIKYRLPQYMFRDEFRNYWDEFHPQKRIDGQQVRSVFIGFKTDAISSSEEVVDVELPEFSDWLDLSPRYESVVDSSWSEQPAQYASDDGVPSVKWNQVTTTLKDLDTYKLHYVLPPKSHIVIDFDIKDNDGNKSLELNKAAALKFPPTYAEVSKGGEGLHLHYYYDGDVSKLSRSYSDGIEVIPSVGSTSIRRRLSTCSNRDIATISSGLPIKGDSMISGKTVRTEQGLRKLILRNLRKEIHPHTKPSVDFIVKILEDANKEGLVYDVSDLLPSALVFAAQSTNNAEVCMKMISTAPWESSSENELPEEDDDGEIIFYDVEVFPNLLLVCWKAEGSGTVQRMFNPTGEQVGYLLSRKLVGFNNRRYDNHILYGRYIGLTNEQIFALSSRIIDGDKTAMFREAYNASWADVYDYSAKKQSLKKWQIELGIFHMELDLPWDEPVDESDWERIAEYCDNDVISLEILHNHLIGDYHARQILAALSGLRVNDKTDRHVAKIIFGNERNPQKEFVYTDLSEMFPGYKYERGVSTYRGETVGEGGYNYSEPGFYRNVLYMDVASMHPTSIWRLKLFGKYTKRFWDLVLARVAIKGGQYDIAADMFEAKLIPYLHNKDEATKLSYALKIALNIAYGYTSARFPNIFRDPRNIDNIVAKRGALFMIDLKHALQERGTKVVHIKTDSVKVADYTSDDIDFIIDFGKQYGYDFGVEGVFTKMALLDKSQLIGKWEHNDRWEAVGAVMQRSYVFKKLFTKEDILLEDLTEVRSVRGNPMHIKYPEEPLFLGKHAVVTPVVEGGGPLVQFIEDSEHHVRDTSGYNWQPSSIAMQTPDNIDMTYFDEAVDKAMELLASVCDPTQLFD
jgi:hypothetical protein